ncbi:SDR family NAD(P)-dependent oxidoreductase [Streptomyces vinaceus]|uniref:SDR family NAD(P)-dependent oxidoreductase n=1 Tax=Streptomyces vinaceus TaxID=1960 RepID=UPI003822BD47
MEDWGGRTVLITGAAQGCGRVLAEAFQQAGATVVACDVDTEGLERLKARKAYVPIHTVTVDVSQPLAVAALLDRVLSDHGRLDAAVNNAGLEVVSTIHDADPADFDRLYATNLRGVLLCMKHEIAVMRECGGGSIVNMSSVTSDMTAVSGNGLYAATKGGVTALTKTAAIEEAGNGISINALAFAAVDVPDGMFWRFLDTTRTPLENILPAFPAGRLAKPQELVDAVAFLASPGSRFITGTSLILDGGYTAQ